MRHRSEHPGLRKVQRADDWLRRFRQQEVGVQQMQEKTHSVSRESIIAILPKLRSEHKKVVSEYLNQLNPEQEKALFERLTDLCNMAEKTFAPLARELPDNPSAKQVQELELKFFDWMALVMPIVGEKSPWLLSREAETGLQNINTGERIWVSQKENRFYSEEEILENHPRLGEDAQGWQKMSGLLIHTAAAAWGIERFLSLMQKNFTLMQQKGRELNANQKNILALNPQVMRIWLLFHDSMRTLSHDSFFHAAALPVFAHLLGISEHFVRDYDLPEILHFKEPNPAELNGGLTPLKVEPHLYEKENHAKLLQQNLAYVQEALKRLEAINVDSLSEEDPQRNPSEAIALFWLIDAFSKLQPAHNIDDPNTPDDFFVVHQEEIETIRNDKVRQALLGILQDVKRTSTNRQINDTGKFLKQRQDVRQSFAGGAQKDDPIANYYSRQHDTAFAFFDWICSTLKIDKQDLWKFFFELTHITHNMLSDEGLFSYSSQDASRSPLGWNTNKLSDSSSSQEHRPFISIFAQPAIQEPPVQEASLSMGETPAADDEDTQEAPRANVSTIT